MVHRLGVGGTVYANRALYEKWSRAEFRQQLEDADADCAFELDYRVDLSEGYQAFTRRSDGVDAKFLYFPTRTLGAAATQSPHLVGHGLDWLEVHLHESAHP